MEYIDNINGRIIKGNMLKSYVINNNIRYTLYNENGKYWIRKKNESNAIRFGRRVYTNDKIALIEFKNYIEHNTKLILPDHIFSYVNTEKYCEWNIDNSNSLVLVLKRIGKGNDKIYFGCISNKCYVKTYNSCSIIGEFNSQEELNLLIESYTSKYCKKDDKICQVTQIKKD